VLSALILAATSALAMVVPAIRPYGEDVLGRSFATLTLALTPALVVGALCFIPAGHMADRFGRSNPFILGQVFLVAGLLAVGATDSLLLAAMAAFLIFVGNVFSVPAWNAAIMDLAPESHRGTLIGLTVALGGLGLAIGPLTGGEITDQFGPQVTFRAAAAVCAVVGVAIWLYARAYGDGHAVHLEEVAAKSHPGG
jgi:MFS family permease